MWTKENKSLIINAAILLLIGGLFLVGFNYYKTQLVVKEYQEYISTVTSYSSEKISDSIIQRKDTLKNGSEIVGYAYVGSDFAEGIPGHNEPSELRIKVIVDKNQEIKAAFIEYSEHTPDYIKYVEQYLKSLAGTQLIDYKKVDEVAGASKYSMPIVREILTEATRRLTGKEPNPAELPDPYKNVFGTYSSIEEDSTFEVLDPINENIVIDGNDIAYEIVVSKKETIKDENGDVIGTAYTVTSSTTGIPYHDGAAKLDLLIGLDSEGKILGIEATTNEHTPTFYSKQVPYLNALNGVNLDDYTTVDVVAGATISRDVIQHALDLVKAVA